MDDDEAREVVTDRSHELVCFMRDRQMPLDNLTATALAFAAAVIMRHADCSRETWLRVCGSCFDNAPEVKGAVDA